MYEGREWRFGEEDLATVARSTCSTLLTTRGYQSLEISSMLLLFLQY